jgi:hypothetical protein
MLEYDAPPPRPWSAQQVKEQVEQYAQEFDNGDIDKGAKGAFVGNMTKEMGGDKWRYVICEYITGYGSSIDMPNNWMRALKKWFDMQKVGEEWTVSEYVPSEIANVKRQAMKEQGQLEMRFEDKQNDL